MTSSSRPVAGDLWDVSLDGAATAKNATDAGPRAWRIIVVGSTILWLIAAFAAFSDVALDLMAFVLLFGVGMLLAVAWLFWTFCLSRGYVRHRSRFEVAQWAFVPLAGLIGLMLLLTDWDTTLRLKLSEPALRRCLAETRRNGSIVFPLEDGRWVGLFRFRSIQDQGSSVEFRADLSYPHGGLIYKPSGGAPPPLGEHHYWHLSGPWWRFEHHY